MVDVSASTPGPITYGQPITLSASVVEQNTVVPPSGTVTFFDGTHALGPAMPVTIGGPRRTISAGLTHTCIIVPIGTPYCWGDGGSGMLGNGGTSPSASPGPVTTTNKFISIAAGQDWTCAITDVGGVQCWGANSRGQLGIGTNDLNSLVPVDVVDLNTPVHAIYAGIFHTCVITEGGGVKCWGDTGGGKLGNGPIFVDKYTSPVDVTGLQSGVVSLASRESRTCAVMNTGSLKCWGFNGDGLFGTGNNNDAVVPVDITILPGVKVTHVALGNQHICVLTDAGGVKCWGRNLNGQLGNNSAFTSTMNTTPVDVLGMTSGVTAIAAGDTHNCALLANGGVKCWGGGPLGTGETSLPAPANYVVGLSSGVTHIASGPSHVCANQVNPTGPFAQSVCWGLNTSSQLGDGSTTSPRDTPVGNGFPSLVPATVSLTTSALKGGLRTVKASYDGTSVVEDTMTVQVDPLATSTTLNVTPNPSALGQALEFSATVTGATNTGNIQFKDGATVLLSIPLGLATPGQAVVGFSGSLFSMGPHTFTAEYVGDGNLASSTSPPVAHTVNGAATNTTLSGAPVSTRPGQPVAFTATVTSLLGTPTGSVTFKDGAAVLGTAPLAGGGVATFNVSSLSIGAHTITAQYVPTGLFGPSSGTTNQLIDARAGGELRMSQFNLVGQRQLPAVARTGNGFVTVWQSDGQDGSGGGIFAQRYKNDGRKISGEFKVNTTVNGAQTLPKVAGVKDGGFVVVWVSSGLDGGGTGIIAQRYQSNGAKWGGEFVVNTGTKGNQSRPSIAGLDDGGFVIAWDGSGDGNGIGVFARRFSKTSKADGEEFQVNTTKSKNQASPAVAAAGTGGFVVAWESESGDTGAGIFAQRFNAGSKPLGFEFRVNTRKAGNQTGPVAAGLDGKGFVIVWTSDGQDGSGLGIYGQRFLANGNKLGAEFRANTTRTMDQSEPAVSGFDAGGFVVTWTSVGQDGSGRGIYGQLFSSDGARTYGEFRGNTTVARDQWQSAVTTLSTGDFVTVWSSRNSDISLEGIYGQRFSADIH
jgi:alpha-tubulin suppressor-like RCC1 family protein